VDAATVMGEEGGPLLGPGAEFRLIRRLVAGAPPPGAGLLGPGDDAALVGDLVLSCDLSVEGVHFRREWLEPREVGYRAAAAALSDLAAMAAEPVGVLVALALPGPDAAELAPLIQAGVREALALTGGVVLGGDLSRSPGPLVLDIMVVGRAREPILRRGARPGDTVWVTGVLGGAAAAVAEWEEGRSPSAGLRRAFAHPVPRVREALWLRERVEITALVDLSDGLAGDAGHLAAASGVRILLHEGSLPLHRGLPTPHLPAEVARRLALSGGEDYELCLTAPAGDVEPWVEGFVEEFGVPLTAVGEVAVGEGVWVAPAGGGEPRPGPEGFSHGIGEMR